LRRGKGGRKRKKCENGEGERNGHTRRMGNEYGRKEVMHRYEWNKQMKEEYIVMFYGCVTIDDIWIGEWIY
jgi:hypothetical protein